MARAAALVVLLFRRDLRLEDNAAVRAACAAAAAAVERAALLPVFVLDPDQVDPARNPFHSANAVRFMLECVEDLARRCPALRVFGGGAADVLGALHARVGRVAAVALNGDVTPFARARDARIAAWCAAHGARLLCPAGPGDGTLVDPSAMDRPYQVFGAFHRRHGAAPPPPPRGLDAADAARLAAALAPLAPAQRRALDALPARVPATRAALARFRRPGAEAPEPAARGGRARGLERLARVASGALAGYGASRDAPGLPGDGTTGLSPYLKFGCVSVREAAAAAAGNAPLLRQLHWRAFYDQVAWHFPHVLAPPPGERRSLRPAHDDRPWRAGAAADADFARWAAGRTGFPLVDAGMRQLARTGAMHNRARMVAASFLVKDLAIDWRRGEALFAARLADYHPPANSGGWQWVAGGGADAPAYTRVMSPWAQARRFDPRAEYVWRHVPELRAVPAADVVAWRDAHARHAGLTTDYPPPMLDHARAARAAVAATRAALRRGRGG